MRNRLWLGVCGTVLCALAVPAHATIILGDATLPNFSPRNTTNFPSNLNAYEGTFGAYLGTPISSQYFVTANHIYDAGNGTFIYNNGTSTPTTYDVARAGGIDDLAIWEITDVNKSFLTYAPLYETNNAVNQPLVVIGRGTQRGAPIYNSSQSLIGWHWGTADSVTSWGTNTVQSIQNNGPAGTGNFSGNFLQFPFMNNGNFNEGIISVGDSGGGVFVKDPSDNVYKLAGINSLVDTFTSTTNGSNPQTSLFDGRGLYDGSTLLSGSSPIPESSYATDIYSRLGTIQQVTSVPEPASVAMVFLLAPLLMARRPQQTTAVAFVS